MKNKEKIEVPKDIMIGLYRIMCGISKTFSGAEVYDEAKDGMVKAHEFIIKYGKENNIDMRGYDEHTKKLGYKK